MAVMLLRLLYRAVRTRYDWVEQGLEIHEQESSCGGVCSHSRGHAKRSARR
jgi:wobble nucleotide-excising tRNase